MNHTLHLAASSAYQFLCIFTFYTVVAIKLTSRIQLGGCVCLKTCARVFHVCRSLRSGVKAQLHETGAVVLRGFDLTKTADGFQQMYLALGLEPCDDPLQVRYGCGLSSVATRLLFFFASSPFSSFTICFIVVGRGARRS